MKKIIAILFLHVFCVGLTFAQKDEEENEKDIKTSQGVTITKSNPYEVVDSRFKTYYATENGIVAIKMVGKTYSEYMFQVFTGDKLNETARKTAPVFEEKFNKMHYSPLGFYRVEKSIFLFYSLYDKPNTTERFFAREVDIENGGFAGKAIKLIEVHEKINSFMGTGKFSMDISEDRTKFVVRFRYIDEKKNGKENKLKYGMAVFNSSLEKLWQEDVNIPYTEEMSDIEDFTVDSKGNGYFLIKKYDKAINRKTISDADNVTMEILEVNDDGKDKIREFKIADNLIRSIVLKENGNGDIVCAGYYSKPKSRAIDGVFCTILSKSGDFSTPTMSEFSIDFIKEYAKLSERKEKKLKEKDDEGDLGMNFLTMRKIHNLKDGGLMLIGEIYYVTTSTDSKGNTRTTYHYDDVILTKINASGEVEWMKKIPKRSTSSTFRSFVSDNFVYISLRDNLKNQNLRKDQNPLGGNSAVVLYKIDLNEGDHEYKILFSSNNIDGTPVHQFYLDRIIPLTENKFAVELYIKGKKDMMFQVEFDE
ncbi:MAG: hypothetical protein WC044_10945 [Crocinitomicaceae bacterium]